MFAHPSAAALNHLLIQNGWALNRLAKFAGKTVQFDVAPFSFCYTIAPDGSLLGDEVSNNPTVRCIISPALLPRLALHDELAHAEIQSEGDSALLAEIFYLSRNLRWDAAEDLSRVTGDIAAERIVQTLQSKQQHLLGSVASLAHSAAEYWTEERPMIAKPGQISSYTRQVDALRDDLARLEQRVLALSTPDGRGK